MLPTFNFFFVLPLVTLISCGPSNSSQTDTFQRINEEVFKNSQAYATLNEASQKIGHRLTGSENGSRAEEYTYELLKSYGYEGVRFHEFQVEAWMRGEVSLEVSVDNGQGYLPVEAVSLAHSPVQASVEAEIIDLGNGLQSDYEAKKDSVPGKIVLVYIGILPEGHETSNLHRSEKTALAIQNGAKGIIIINQVEGNVLLTGTASVKGKLIDIPAICIGKEDGFALKEKLKESPVSAKVEMTNSSNMIKARNVVASLQGSELPEEQIVVGGHLDSWDLATGAIDNGIGSFAILDIARTFKALGLKPRRTINFVMFMGEEQGLLGSKAMVNEKIEDGSLGGIKYMVNLDMSGNPVGFNAGGRQEATDFFMSIGEKINQFDSLFTNNFKNTAGLHSDHQPFMLEGIPVVSLVSNLDPSVYACYHSDCDDMELVDRTHMENTVRFTTMMLYELANTDTLPALKLNDQETRQFLAGQGLKEKLVLGGDWKWGN